MGIQEDVNEMVAGVHSLLDEAANSAADMEPVPVDLSGELAAIEDEVDIDFNPVRAALLAVADAVDALSGDSVALRTAIDAIGTQTIDFQPVKGSIEAVESVMNALSQNIINSVSVSSKGVQASSAIANLLIDQSNFDGSNQ